MQHGATLEGPCFNEVEHQRFVHQREERQSAADRHWMRHDVVLIDKAVLDQRVHESDAAVDEDLLVGRRLKLGDFFFDVTPVDRCVLPVERSVDFENTTFGISFIAGA